MPSASDLALVDAEEYKDEDDVLLVAQHYFDSREFERCAFKLKECKSPKARFLAAYASYLVPRQLALCYNAVIDTRDRLQNDKHCMNGTRLTVRASCALLLRGLMTAGSRNQPSAPINQQALGLLAALGTPTDPFLLFLRGLLLYRAKRRAEAIAALVGSVTAYPWNWAAWLQLCACFNDRKEVRARFPLLPARAERTVGSGTRRSTCCRTIL